MVDSLRLEGVFDEELLETYAWLAELGALVEPIGADALAALSEVRRRWLELREDRSLQEAEARALEEVRHLPRASCREIQVDPGGGSAAQGACRAADEEGGAQAQGR